MAQRDYNGVDFGARDTRQAFQGQVANVAFQPDKTITVGDGDWAGSLIKDLTGKASGILMNLHEQHLEDRYLEGAAKVGQIESEEEIAGNPLSRDWEVAGYRDTANRLQMAEAESQIAVDMEKLKQESPEKMNEYLASMRAKLTPNLQSGSREQRAANFAKLMTTQAAAQKKHAAEHQGWIQEVTAKTIRTSWNTVTAGLEGLRTKAAFDPTYQEAYSTAVADAGVRVNADIWANPALSAGNKAALTQEVLENILSTDGGDIYQFVKTTKMLNPEIGQEDFIIDRLPGEVQNKLSSKHVEYLEKNKGRILGEYSARLSMVKAQLDSEAGLDMDLPSFERMLSEGLVNKALNFDSATSLRTQYFKSKSDARDVYSIVAMARSGNHIGLRDAGHSGSDVVKALSKVHAKEGAKIATRVGDLIQLGERGVKEAFTDLGAITGPLYSQLLNPNVPENAETAQIFNAVDVALTKAGPVSEMQFFSEMPKEQAEFFRRVRAVMKARGASTSEAAALVAEEQVLQAKLGPAAIAARAQAFAADDKKELDSYTSQGIIKGLMSRWMPSWAGGVAQFGQLAPEEDVWEENRSVIAQQEQTLRAALQLEMADVRLSDNLNDSNTVMVKAAANLAQRSIRTGYNTVIMPDKQTPDQYFGKNTDKDTLGKAVQNIIGKPKFGGRFTIKAMAEGLVVSEESGKDNEPVKTKNTFVITRDQVRSEVDRMTASKVQRERLLVGEGRTVQIGDTPALQYNGENNASVRQDWMFQFRETLVSTEGVRNTTYKDTGGVDTFGVGIANKQYWAKPAADGKYTKEQISESFRAASNDAAKSGRFVQDITGLQSQSAFLLFAEMSYQGGATKASDGSGFGWYVHKDKAVRQEYRDFVDSLKSGDSVKAIEKFNSTAIGRVLAKAGQNKPEGATGRLKHYHTLIEQTMKGM